MRHRAARPPRASYDGRPSDPMLSVGRAAPGQRRDESSHLAGATMALGVIMRRQPPGMRAQQVTARHHPDDRAWSVARHDRHPSHLLAHHVIRRLACRAVVIDHDGRACDEIADTRRDWQLQIEQVAARHDAGQRIVLIENGVALMAAARRPGDDPVADVFDRIGGMEDDRRGRRDVADQDLAQVVGLVFGLDASPAARDLLGHDRECGMSRSDTRIRRGAPARSGSRPIGWRVVSNAKTTEASSACEAPAKIAAMPTSAAMRASTCRHGAQRSSPAPSSAPSPPPIVKSGASVPPEVPLPSAIAQETNLNATQNEQRRARRARPRGCARCCRSRRRACCGAK